MQNENCYCDRDNRSPNDELELLWLKKRDDGRALLVEVFSNDDRRMGMVKGAQGKFAKAPIGELFVEKVSVSKEKFAAEDRLCMAFFSREEKMAFISGGPRSFYNRRLDLYKAGQGE